MVFYYETVKSVIDDNVAASTGMLREDYGKEYE